MPGGLSEQKSPAVLATGCPAWRGRTGQPGLPWAPSHQFLHLVPSLRDSNRIPRLWWFPSILTLKV